ncbi:ribosomal-processing cysteine protease Prp [Blautia sp. HCP28S3_G10]|uniref:ribosomal-processing cysteine protease Prp n=1 Tax=Blautia sp. HCP28S3_G10 TaxID=3438908 RepID=UPI003F8B4E6E
MITVTVSRKQNSYISFTSRGHAGYAEEGQDIICAAVSVLVINTVNSLERLTGDHIEVKEDDGFVSFTFTEPVSEGGTLLMDSLILGLTEIQHSYSNRYLKVKVREV